MDKTDDIILKFEKNHVLYNNADNDCLLRLFGVQIQNYDLLRVWLCLRLNSKFVSRSKKKTSNLEIRRRFCTVGVVYYLNDKTAQMSRLLVFALDALALCIIRSLKR